MPNFQNSKIYKIVNNNTDLVYYGSTTQPLYKRFFEHKKIYSRCTSKKILEGENPQIILVEKYPCVDKYELQKKEREYIEGNICVNKHIPTRTIKEWRETYKKRYNEYRKEWNKNNKDKIKEYTEKNKDKFKKYCKEYYEKNKDKKIEYIKEYYKKNKEKVKETGKKYREVNKDKINEKITCICGSTYTKRCKTRHEKTKKHQNFIKKD